MSENVQSQKDTKLAIALASGKNQQQAAVEAGVCTKTVSRRLKNPRFRRRLAILRNQMISAALGRMAENMTKAADCLAELLHDDQNNLRFRAARALVQLTVKTRDSVDIAERIYELEMELKRKQGVIPYSFDR